MQSAAASPACIGVSSTLTVRATADQNSSVINLKSSSCNLDDIFSADKFIDADVMIDSQFEGSDLRLSDTEDRRAVFWDDPFPRSVKRIISGFLKRSGDLFKYLSSMSGCIFGLLLKYTN